MTRLPDSVHTDRPWLIHEIAPDFALEDVWRIAMPGAGPGDFARALEVVRSSVDEGSLGPVARLLFAVRWRLGALLGWDETKGGLGDRVSPVADRVPGHLRPGADLLEDSPFALVYQLEDEAAEEVASSTVHGILHLMWLPGDEGHELRCAVLTQPNGVPGRAYMAAITPVRVLVVWPALVRTVERAWQAYRAPVRGGRTDQTPEGLTIAPDYVDRFELATDLVASPREWATAMFEEGVPRRDRELLFRTVLGCALDDDGAPGTLAGLQVAHEDDHRMALTMAGPRVRTQLLVEVSGRGVSLTTTHEYVSPLGRAIWSLVGVRHRQLAAPLLREAAGLLRSGSAEEPVPG